MAELSEKEREKLYKKYERNEDKNYHTENALMLINRFGTSEEKKTAKAMKREIDKRGYVTHEESQYFYEHAHNKYYSLIRGN